MYTLYIYAHAFSWKSFRLNRLLPGEATRMRVSRREARCESRGAVRRCVAIYTDGSYSGENLPDEATRALCTGTHNALHRLPCRIQNTGRALRVTLHTLVNWLLHASRSFPFSLSLSLTRSRSQLPFVSSFHPSWKTGIIYSPSPEPEEIPKDIFRRGELFEWKIHFFFSSIALLYVRVN